MPRTVEETLLTLDSLGLLTQEEAQALLAELPAEMRPNDGATLIEALARRGRLTSYQAEALRHRPQKPLLLSNYLLMDLIGSGGMGRVFKALHRRMDRLVALKVLHEKAVESRDAVERFHREVKAAARLQHPHIVAAYDADEDQGLHFLVMEYVDGPDLATIVKNGPLTLERAVDVIAQAARGLEYAHGEGVIHRDIKPANLLVNPKGVVKILDMGIARIAASSSLAEDETRIELTQAGAILGTVDYMAPEQALDSKNADQRSDIYSLGCTLYYLLAGAPLHPGKTVVEKIIAHREREAPPLRALRPDAPVALEELVQRMTVKGPERRVASMGEVAEALEKLREEIAADPSSAVAFSAISQAATGQPPQDVTVQLSSETLGGLGAGAIQALERFVDGCAAVDRYFDVDEEHAVFRKGGELGLELTDVQSILDRRCEAHGWIRHSKLTEQLKQMLEQLAQNDGYINQREFDRLIRHAVDCRMPRRQAEEHCLTLMLDHQWQAKESFWNRWFTRRCQKHGLE